MFSSFQINQIDDGCGIAESDLLTLPPTCTSLKETSYIELPIAQTALSEACTQPVEFFYKGINGIYTDLKNSQIYLKCQLVHQDGSPLAKDEPVGPINHLGMLYKFLFTCIITNCVKKTIAYLFLICSLSSVLACRNLH